MSRGFIPLWRKLYSPDHPLAPSKRDPSNRRDAWLDICQMAQHDTFKHAGERLNRGEVLLAVRTCASRWFWSKSKTDRYFKYLIGEAMIGTVRGTPSGTVYSVVNYETYATPQTGQRDTQRDMKWDRSGTAAGQHRDKNNNEPLTMNNPPSSTAPEKTAHWCALGLWLGDHAEAIDGLEDYTVRSVNGLYAENGTSESVWGDIGASGRPAMLASAIYRWSGEGRTDFNGRLFRRILETVIQEGQNGGSRRSGPSAKVGQAAGGYIIPSGQGAFKKYVDGDSDF